MDTSNPLISYFFEQGLLGVLTVVASLVTWQMYKSNKQLLEEKGGVVLTMSEQRIRDLEDRMAELRNLYNADLKYMEARMEEMEKNTSMLIEKFGRALDLFQKSTEHYEQAVERMERTEQKIDRVSWELENVNKKLDKMGE